MTNEELCECIRAGQTDLLEDLVKQNMDFVKATANMLFIPVFIVMKQPGQHYSRRPKSERIKNGRYYHFDNHSGSGRIRCLLYIQRKEKGQKMHRLPIQQYIFMLL